MIRRPPRSTLDRSSAASDVYKRQVYSRNGDRANAALMYAAASGAGPEVNSNQGILDIRNGNYSMAVSNLSAAGSYNTALAKLLAGDKDGAMSSIEASDDKNTAEGHYLMACLLYTSDAADERSSVDLGGRRILKKNNQERGEVHDETMNTTESYTTTRHKIKTSLKRKQ